MLTGLPSGADFFRKGRDIRKSPRGQRVRPGLCQGGTWGLPLPGAVGPTTLDAVLQEGEWNSVGA